MLGQQARATKSGAAASKVVMYKYYNELEFLCDAASKLAMCKYYNELAFLCDKTANKPIQINVNIITVPDERVNVQPIIQ